MALLGSFHEDGMPDGIPPVTLRRIRPDYIASATSYVRNNNGPVCDLRLYADDGHWLAVPTVLAASISPMLSKLLQSQPEDSSEPKAIVTNLPRSSLASILTFATTGVLSDDPKVERDFLALGIDLKLLSYSDCLLECIPDYEGLFRKDSAVPNPKAQLPSTAQLIQQVTDNAANRLVIDSSSVIAKAVFTHGDTVAVNISDLCENNDADEECLDDLRVEVDGSDAIEGEHSAVDGQEDDVSLAEAEIVAANVDLLYHQAHSKKKKPPKNRYLGVRRRRKKRKPLPGQQAVQIDELPKDIREGALADDFNALSEEDSKEEVFEEYKPEEDPMEEVLDPTLYFKNGKRKKGKRISSTKKSVTSPVKAVVTSEEPDNEEEPSIRKSLRKRRKISFEDASVKLDDEEEKLVEEELERVEKEGEEEDSEFAPAEEELVKEEEEEEEEEEETKEEAVAKKELPKKKQPVKLSSEYKAKVVARLLELKGKGISYYRN